MTATKKDHLNNSYHEVLTVFDKAQDNIARIMGPDFQFPTDPQKFSADPDEKVAQAIWLMAQSLSSAAFAWAGLTVGLLGSLKTIVASVDALNAGRTTEKELPIPKITGLTSFKLGVAHLGLLTALDTAKCPQATGYIAVLSKADGWVERLRKAPQVLSHELAEYYKNEKDEDAREELLASIPDDMEYLRDSILAASNVSENLSSLRTVAKEVKDIKKTTKLMSMPMMRFLVQAPKWLNRARFRREGLILLSVNQFQDIDLSTLDKTKPILVKIQEDPIQYKLIDFLSNGDVRVTPLDSSVMESSQMPFSDEIGEQKDLVYKKSYAQIFLLKSDSHAFEDLSMRLKGYNACVISNGEYFYVSIEDKTVTKIDNPTQKFKSIMENLGESSIRSARIEELETIKEQTKAPVFMDAYHHMCDKRGYESSPVMFSDTDEGDELIKEELEKIDSYITKLKSVPDASLESLQGGSSIAISDIFSYPLRSATSTTKRDGDLIEQNIVSDHAWKEGNMGVYFVSKSRSFVGRRPYFQYPNGISWTYMVAGWAIAAYNGAQGEYTPAIGMMMTSYAGLRAYKSKFQIEDGSSSVKTELLTKQRLEDLEKAKKSTEVLGDLIKKANKSQLLIDKDCAELLAKRAEVLERRLQIVTKSLSQMDTFAGNTRNLAKQQERLLSSTELVDLKDEYTSLTEQYNIKQSELIAIQLHMSTDLSLIDNVPETIVDVKSNYLKVKERQSQEVDKLGQLDFSLNNSFIEVEEKESSMCLASEKLLKPYFENLFLMPSALFSSFKMRILHSKITPYMSVLAFSVGVAATTIALGVLLGNPAFALFSVAALANIATPLCITGVAAGAAVGLAGGAGLLTVGLFGGDKKPETKDKLIVSETMGL
ncbi:MAG: hypothetical protein P1U74_04520 [Legionellaceae bacterium]|nr:hypothetical protein [Legionellaceae bacterium]